MFRVEALPAAHGDCLWMEWGRAGRVWRMIVDGGPAQTYRRLRERIQHLPTAERRFELLVVTHIDADHIEGAIRLLQDSKALGLHFDRIWFNGRKQLDAVPDPAGQPLGTQQGDFLSLLIEQYEQEVGRHVHNADSPDAFVGVAERGLEAIPLGDGATVTVLSPDNDRLLKLKDDWEAVTDEASLRSDLQTDARLKPIGDELGGDDVWSDVGRRELPVQEDLLHSDKLGGRKSPGADTSIANGSSIALLFEYDGHAALLAGDAFPAVLGASIDRLLEQRSADRLDLDLFKLPHHGSVANLSSDLLEKLRCSDYLVSTSGAYYRHPDKEAIELVLACHASRRRPKLHFNYHSPTTEAWWQASEHARRTYESQYPSGVSLEFFKP